MAKLARPGAAGPTSNQPPRAPARFWCSAQRGWCVAVSASHNVVRCEIASRKMQRDVARIFLIFFVECRAIMITYVLRDNSRSFFHIVNQRLTSRTNERERTTSRERETQTRKDMITCQNIRRCNNSYVRTI
jgi:hypothetical protein